MHGTAVIIPARLGAERLPGKPLARIGKLPLIVWVARQASKASTVDRVVVATDAEEIGAACSEHGVEHAMTSASHQSGTDRVAEVAETLDCARIINVQGDEPFLDPRDVDSIARALEQGARIATLRAPIENDEDFADSAVVKVVCDDRGQALYFSRSPIPHFRSGEALSIGRFRHIGVYGYTREALREWTRAPQHELEKAECLEQLRALAMGLSITVRDAFTRCRGIDTPDDLKWARERVERLGDAAFP